MREHVNESNAMYHCKEMHKLLLNAAFFSTVSGTRKTRWTVGEIAHVFDAAWGRGRWRYGMMDIVRIMKTLRDMGLVHIETGLFGRIKAYSLSETSLQLLSTGLVDPPHDTEAGGVF